MKKHVCSRAGCGKPASRYPEILLNAVGDGRSRSRALRLIVPVAVCLECQPGFDPQDFLLPESRKRLRVELMKRGKAMPNFDGAWVEWRHIGDSNWVNFHLMQREKGNG